MEQYIDKAAIVADIERRIKTNKECMLGLRNLDYYQGKVDALKDTLSSLNTFEVKEVDINKEISQFISANFEKATIGHKLSLRRTAKHFFELGLKAQKGE